MTLRRCTAILLATLLAGIASAGAPPTPPSQPAHGPGGADYVHATVVAREVEAGAAGWWLFTPAAPVPAEAPVVVFCHGWGALEPRGYRAWIDHLVRRGNIVVYPNYQDSLRTPPERFLPNAVTGVRNALAALHAGGGPRPRLDRVAIVGHSAGGLLAAEIAAVAAEEGLPGFRAVMPVEPGDGSREGRRRASVPSIDVAPLPASTLLLVLVGADDHLAGEALGLRLFDEARRIPASNKNALELRSDFHGAPALIANHAAPAAMLVPDDADGRPSLRDRRHHGTVDALDWYGTWRLFDALCDAAFTGRHREDALGGGARQTAMGRWSDGVPVAALRVLR